MLRRAAFFLIILAPALLPAGLAMAANTANLDVQSYRRAFAMLDAGHAERAASYKGHDRVLNKVLRAAYMAQPGNDAGFAEMTDFINNNPGWPGLRGIVAIAEQKIPPQMSAEQSIEWFKAHPPVTLVGFDRYIDALETTGQTQEASQLVRARLIDGEFGAEELSNFYARFNRDLDADTMDARLDKLDWKNDVASARRMYGYVDVAHRNLSEARLSYANKIAHPENAASKVSAEVEEDPGLLFEKTRWLQRNNRDDEAVEMLQRAPDELGDPEAWWEVRQIMAHRLMDKHDFSTAYELAANHGQKDPKTLSQAEFLAGWLALRFLNEPEKAERHFKILLGSATTPLTRARGAYWLGRAQEALGEKAEAEQSYEEAATLNITFYGQLATTRIYAHPTIQARPEPTVPPGVRSAFFARDNIAAIEKLHDLGEDKHTHAFFHAATESSTQRADFALLMELAYQIKRPDLAIEAAKAANQRNMLVGAGGFPLLDRALPRPPEPAFTHALIRQESMFNPKAESPVGAEGLMQLMPGTAKAMAKVCGLRYKEARLCDLDYNLRLGTAFIQNQLNMFDGSYVLTLAAYNAGPGRVREWMNQIGDPRSPNVDPIDWIEEIPVSETRNYVQRIIESLQVYRAKLNGGEAPLAILNDLRR